MTTIIKGSGRTDGKVNNFPFLAKKEIALDCMRWIQIWIVKIALPETKHRHLIRGWRFFYAQVCGGRAFLFVGYKK